MNLTSRHFSAIARLARAFFLAFLLAFNPAVSPIARGDERADHAKAVQGKWMRRQATANGRVTIVKEHQAQKTIVNAYDDQGKLVYAHTSDYTIEQSGKVRIFTFSNRTITAGPNAGQIIKDPASFVYRVAENRFIEVHGVLDGDTNAPLMIIWERVKDEAQGRDAT